MTVKKVRRYKSFFFFLWENEKGVSSRQAISTTFGKRENQIMRGRPAGKMSYTARWHLQAPGTMDGWCKVQNESRAESLNRDVEAPGSRQHLTADPADHSSSSQSSVETGGLLLALYP